MAIGAVLPLALLANGIRVALVALGDLHLTDVPDSVHALVGVLTFIIALSLFLIATESLAKQTKRAATHGILLIIGYLLDRSDAGLVPHGLDHEGWTNGHPTESLSAWRRPAPAT